MILSHPELLVLPLFTEVVPGPFDGGKHYPACCRCCKCRRCCTWSCCCKGCEVVHTNKVVISKEMSWTKLLYMTVIMSFFAYAYILDHSASSNSGKIENALFLIHIPVKILCFIITLHYGRSKGMLVIDNTGETRCAFKEEL